MRIGVNFPQTEIGSDPAVVRDYVQTAEALHYTHVLAYDHVLGADPNREGGWTGYTKDSAFHEPLTLFAYLAGLTREIEFATGVLILPQRQTALVAKQAAEIDLLSGGRLRLGVGTGWNAIEYEALGQDFHTRGRREEEQIELLRRLWSEETLDYSGRWHRIDRAGINPRPSRQIPIWLGGSAEALLKRAARIGDGWFASPAPGRAEEGRAIVPRLRDYVREAGRDPAAFGIECAVHHGDGNAESWQQQLRAWQSLDATHCVFDTMRCGFTSPQQHIDAIRRFAEVRDAVAPTGAR